MLSRFLVVLYFAFGASFVGKYSVLFLHFEEAHWTCLSVAQSSVSIVCVAGQCLQGFANITRGSLVKQYLVLL